MIYFTGDTHGDKERLSKFALKQLKSGDTLIVCGDFGFLWDESKKEKKFLEKLSKRNYTICFIDGTHENFELLEKIPDWLTNLVNPLAQSVAHHNPEKTVTPGMPELVRSAWKRLKLTDAIDQPGLEQFVKDAQATGLLDRVPPLDGMIYRQD